MPRRGPAESRSAAQASRPPPGLRRTTVRWAELGRNSTTGLPALTGGRVYEVWFMAPGRIREAGLLPQPAAGRTAPLLAAGLTPADRIGVTAEPAGGTRQPTTSPTWL